MVIWSHELGQNVMVAGLRGGGPSWTGSRGTGDRHNLQKPAARTYFLQLSPPPKVFTTFQNSATSWGPSSEHMSLWGTFPIQSITPCWLGMKHSIKKEIKP
jgi:hypothetical protein